MATRTRLRGGRILAGAAIGLALGVFAVAQQGQSGVAPRASKPRPAVSVRDLSGKWLRVTPFQTYSNVKGGANEFQNEITAGKVPDLTRDTGLKYNEACSLSIL